MRKQKKLGKWQVAALAKIARQEICCHRSLLSMLKGEANKWSYKYKRNLRKAIEAHNSLIAINSPVDPYFIIHEDGQSGFKLIPRVRTP
jgi:hypothetical protein